MSTTDKENNLPAPKYLGERLTALMQSSGVERAAAGFLLGFCSGYLIFKVAMIVLAAALGSLLVASVVSALQLVNVDWSRVTMLTLNMADWLTTRWGPRTMNTVKRLVDRNTPFYGGCLIGAGLSIIFIF